MELKELTQKLSIELLKNPLIMFLLIIGIGGIIIKYGIPIIKIIKIEKLHKKHKKL